MNELISQLGLLCKRQEKIHAFEKMCKAYVKTLRDDEESYVQKQCIELQLNASKRDDYFVKAVERDFITFFETWYTHISPEKTRKLMMHYNPSYTNQYANGDKEMYQEIIEILLKVKRDVRIPQILIKLCTSS